jgi:hypothetical protein
MSRIKENMKTLNRKPVYGFKSVKAYGSKEFGPLFVNQCDRWKIGEWQKPNYIKVNRWISVKSGKKVSGSGMYAIVIRALRAVGGALTKVKPMITAGSLQERGAYECGFHFFTDLFEADRWQRDHYPSQRTRKLVLCEFTGVTSSGSQWEREVKVARRMRIIKIINRSQLKELKEDITDGKV